MNDNPAIRRNRRGIDREIRDVVSDLNKQGYRTTGSCAGHHKGQIGFVSVAPSKNEIKRELATIPQLFDWYKTLGFSSNNVDEAHIKQIFKKHGIYPVKHERPDFTILKDGAPGKSWSVTHFFTFAPRQLEE